MVEKTNFIYNNMNVYIDEYQEDNKMLVGRKQGSDEKFMICNKKTVNILERQIIYELRKKKLDSL